jgi:hypothetical protein
MAMPHSSQWLPVLRLLLLRPLRVFSKPKGSKDNDSHFLYFKKLLAVARPFSFQKLPDYDG